MGKNNWLLPVLGGLAGAFFGPGVGLVPGMLGFGGGALVGAGLNSALNSSQSNPMTQQSYQSPPPPPPADTHGAAASGMSSDPSTSGMNIDQKSALTPREQIQRAILARKASVPQI